MKVSVGISESLLPSIFDNYFTTGTEIHSHFTRASKSYCTIQAKSNTKRFSAKHNGPNIWNLIPAKKSKWLLICFFFKRYLRNHFTSGSDDQ